MNENGLRADAAHFPHASLFAEVEHLTRELEQIKNKNHLAPAKDGQRRRLRDSDVT
ncbi:hypothetical protein [Sinorhizobium sp. 7-81]|uniref:hypothetical protein n=1 Tax=Sinorhizobium sp. 7-81 TaxID=3049087 RepID=UPI0024C362F9|nr:hypothetical protein [Sinorhizobium sp. 7-81]